MLSPNTLLNGGRYRLESLLTTDSAWSLYRAFDTSTGAFVLIVETAGVEPPATLHHSHDGLVDIQQTFIANGRSYTVTEPLASLPLLDAVVSTKGASQRLPVLLNALDALRKHGEHLCEIAPETIVKTYAGKIKLLPLEKKVTVTSADDPYAPLESLWEDLDHISQKALYKLFGDESITRFEQQADETTELYALGAAFYHLLSGSPPMGAFERALESLDSHEDPLKQLTTTDVSKGMAEFVLKLMQLRREDRFPSAQHAIRSLPVTNDDILDDVDLLLDVPTTAARPSPRRASAPVAVAQVVRPAAAVSTVTPTTPAILKLSDFHPPKEFFPTVERREPTIAPVRDDTDLTVSEVPVPIAEEQKAVSFAAEKPASHRSRRPLAIAVGIVAFLCGGTWGVFQFAGGAMQPVATRTELVLPVDPPPAVTEVQTVPIPSPEPAAVEPADPSAELNTVQNAPRSGQKPRPQTAQVKAPSASISIAGNQPKPKKKVTVDDLINDN
ncbi:MAG TPA: hypothetical protein VGO43_10690 [Pyrinomonadaceae bacterium]|nr:hypothetical protein [Pyrinomonadaceae bacterium]